PGRAQGVRRPASGWYTFVRARRHDARAGLPQSWSGYARSARAARRYRRRRRWRRVSGQGRAPETCAVRAFFPGLGSHVAAYRSAFFVGLVAACNGGIVRRILIIGATSAIAEATARIFAARGDALFLAARNAAHLQTIADDLKVRGATRLATAVL